MRRMLAVMAHQRSNPTRRAFPGVSAAALGGLPAQSAHLPADLRSRRADPLGHRSRRRAVARRTGVARALPRLQNRPGERSVHPRQPAGNATQSRSRKYGRRSNATPDASASEPAHLPNPRLQAASDAAAPWDSRTAPLGYVCCLARSGELTVSPPACTSSNGLAFAGSGTEPIVAETYRRRLWKAGGMRPRRRRSFARRWKKRRHKRWKTSTGNRHRARTPGEPPW